MAQLAWLYYRYSNDQNTLKEVAWPLLVGAFEGYWAMKEEITNEEGQLRISLPVSVSPEYRGSAMNAWGRDASFQLAAFRMVSEILPEAATVLNKPRDERWQEALNRLPHYATITAPFNLEHGSNPTQRIALWEGQDLDESHRHHSHLAGIYPFNTFDPQQAEHLQISGRSYDHWVRKGAGNWSGWCVPWASILHNRFHGAEAAVAWLHYWRENFVNEGRGTLHNAAHGGVSNISSLGWHHTSAIENNREVMQLDAGFGALSAALDLLVHTTRGTVYVLPDIHRDWKNIEFEGILAEGGFLIDARVRDGKTKYIRVTSQFGGPIRLKHGLGDQYLLNDEAHEGAIFTRTMNAGESMLLRSRE
jgi:hypothetical protein